MTEEEKEAIENIKALKILFEIDDKKDFEATPSVQKEMAKDLRTLLNLIEKLQKENEELNNRCRNLDKEAQAYLEELAGDNTLTRRTIKQLQEENEELKALDLRNSIPVQKVKDKIEELNKQLEEDLQDEIKVNSNRFIIICQCKSCLQELLGGE